MTTVNFKNMNICYTKVQWFIVGKNVLKNAVDAFQTTVGKLM